MIAENYSSIKNNVDIVDVLYLVNYVLRPCYYKYYIVHNTIDKPILNIFYFFAFLKNMYWPAFFSLN